MESLRTRDLPNKLYRVQYPSCQTRFYHHFHDGQDPELRANDTTAFYQHHHQLVAFRVNVRNHIDWKYYGSRPFITVFSDKEHAINWALRAPWNTDQKGSSNCQLYTIDTTLLGPKIYVFKLSTLVDHLDITIREEAEQDTHGAYLFLHRVPGKAIIPGQTREELVQGTVISQFSEAPSKRELIHP